MNTRRTSNGHTAGWMMPFRSMYRLSYCSSKGAVFPLDSNTSGCPASPRTTCCRASLYRSHNQRVNFGTPMLAGQGNKTTRQVGCTNKRSNTHPLDTLKKDAGTRQKRTLLSIFAQESSKFGHLAELQHLHIKTLCRYDMMWYSCYGTLRRAS